MKKISVKTLLFMLILFFANRASAVPIDFSNVPFPSFSLGGQSMTEFKICQIRRVFCGKVSLVIIASAIFYIGIMVMNKRVHWSVGILSIAGAVIFYNAINIATLFYRANSLFFVTNPLCDCNCKVDFFDFDINALSACSPQWGAQI